MHQNNKIFRSNLYRKNISINKERTVSDFNTNGVDLKSKYKNMLAIREVSYKE